MFCRENFERLPFPPSIPDTAGQTVSSWLAAGQKLERTFLQHQQEKQEQRRCE